MRKLKMIKFSHIIDDDQNEGFFKFGKKSLPKLKLKKKRKKKVEILCFSLNYKNLYFYFEKKFRYQFSRILIQV